jgi:carbon monoxide dehydrogenase subunit G
LGPGRFRRGYTKGDFVQLNVAENLQLEAAADEVWRLLRDTSRLAGLLPGVENVTALTNAGHEAYAARVAEKVGPFKVTMNLEIQVTEMVEGQSLKASVKGGDSLGMNRVTGTIQVVLKPADADGPDDGAQNQAQTMMHFEAAIEVLGKLATLGAPVVRRKTSDMFSEFARRIQGQFAKVSS